MKRENETWATRLYRRLLRLYPTAFRERHGEEMVRLFHERDEQCAPSGGRWRFRIGAAIDAIQNGIGERLSGGSRARRHQEHPQRASRQSVARDVRASRIDGVWRDVRYAVRVLARAPRFTLPALTLLVLGIGSTTAIFSVAYAVLVRPLPYREAERLVHLAEKGGSGIAWPNFEDWRSRAGSLDLASSLADAVIVTSGPVPRRFESLSVTSNFFRVLGVTPVRGRLFDDSDARPNADATAVVGHAFWMSELGGSPAAIGQTISINRRPFTVIGVLPPGFRYMTPADVYLLLEPQVAADYRGMTARRTHTTLYAVARLKPDVSVAAARTEMQTIVAALAAAYPDTNRDSDVQLVALADRVAGDIAPTLTVLAGAVLLLLLIACVNLAGLLLNRSASRAHELSIRAAIGGSRRTLIGQLLIEQALLVATGGVLGAMAGAAILAGLVSVAPPDLPRLDEIRVDAAVLSVTTLFCCACAFLFGIVPALKASGVGVQELALRAGRSPTRSAASLRRSLMIAQITVAMVLLSGAGLMVNTMVRLAGVDSRFDPDNQHSFSFSLTGSQWPDTRKQVFYDAVVERLRAVPGVENAAVTYSMPGLGSNWWNVFNLSGGAADAWISAGEPPWGAMMPVTAGYFETLGIPLVEGRFFDRSDTPESVPVAIVTSNIARKYWPNGDALGQQLIQGRPSEPFGPWRTIVGVVADVKQLGVDMEPPAQVYMPLVQQPRTTVIAIARTRSPMSASTLEAAIHDLDRTIPVFNERTIDQAMRDASSRRRIAMVVLSVFGAVAVLLAVIGVYGVMSLAVAERRQEIGLRMALGATGGEIRRLFLRHGLVVVAVGITCGVALAMAAVRSLASLVFGVTVTDPATLGGVAALLTVVTMLACYMPARSATRVDPLEALRRE